MAGDVDRWLGSPKGRDGGDRRNGTYPRRLPCELDDIVARIHGWHEFKMRFPCRRIELAAARLLEGDRIGDQSPGIEICAIMR